MDTRAGRRLSDAPEQRWIPSLAELALELPIKMSHAVTILLHPESTRPGRDGIAIGPMNHDWVRRCSMNSDKHGDLP